jgi:hypothetical protein
MWQTIPGWGIKKTPEWGIDIIHTVSSRISPGQILFIGAYKEVTRRNDQSVIIEAFKNKMEVGHEKKFVCMRFRSPHSIAFCFIGIGR